MVYDALHKRSAYLDAFAQRLEMLGVKTHVSGGVQEGIGLGRQI